MNEHPLQDRLISKLNHDNIRMFRNNVGVAYQGNVKRIGFRSVIIRNCSAIRFGLCPGSSDLIGWKSVTVTPEMVGKQVAVFTAIEVKRPNKSKTTKGQINFIEQVKKAGGIGMILSDITEVINENL